MSNLLDNAIKFTPEGGKVIVSVDEHEGGVVICVEDTGIGIPSEDIPLLFNRFHRAQNALGYPGSGLGLAMVKSIIEGHKGEVHAERLEHGTRIGFTLSTTEDR